MSTAEMIKTLHPFEIKIILLLDNKPFSINDISGKTGLNESQTRSGINWLEAKNLIKKEKEEIKIKYVFTDKGHEYKQKGLIEPAISNHIQKNPKANPNDLMNNLDYEKQDIGSAFGYLKKNNEIIQESGDWKISNNFNAAYYDSLTSVLIKFEEKQEIFEDQLEKEERETTQTAFNIPLHRSFFKIKEIKTYTYRALKEGLDLKEVLEKENLTGDEISQITPEMLKEKAWKNRIFREYNINLPAPHILIGRKHPYREFLDLLKYKFVSLGFKEMQGSLVETEFWNMDALYMPQTHPARDIHDIYMIEEPQYAKSIKEPYFSNVAETHQTGGKTGSKGWGYKFDKEKAKQLILRSQGTVLSARQLTEKPQIPGKYFGIARCFRYDKVDATHLADFFQVEGIVLSKTADFPTLLGLLKIFAEEIAMAKEIKYVPGYFPFTEPSVEVHIKHPKLGWFELGGAGIFRPEVTLPLGIDVPVIAWGLGIDRMAMMVLGINDIRNLFTRDLDLLRKTRMVQ
ncbi:MAG: phenylalanine--tRNA ligase subunit alpha [Spirochaetes bacterium]|nr:phenylalanine--tRNA ligase subunit alpha [Spirochaetota bacterium]